MQIDVRGPITLDEASLTRTAVLDSAGVGYIFEQDILPDIDAGRVIRILDTALSGALPLLSWAAQSIGWGQGFLGTSS